MATSTELIDWLSDDKTRALKIFGEGHNELGPRYYTVDDGILYHHPGVREDGVPRGVIGVAKEQKLSFDVSEYDYEKIDVSETPF